MSDFSSYHKQFKDTAHDVETSISRLSRMNSEDKKHAINHITKEIEECERSLQHMESIARRDPSKAVEYQGAIRKSNERLALIKRDLSKAKSSQQFGGRAELFDSPDNLEEWSRDQRDRLLDGNRRLDNATDRIDDTHRVAVETEEIGRNTLEVLEGQRGQLKNAVTGLDDIDANMSKTKKMLTQMYVKVLSNKILLAFLVIAELVAIALIVYFKFFYSSS